MWKFRFWSYINIGEEKRFHLLEKLIMSSVEDQKVRNHEMVREMFDFIGLMILAFVMEAIDNSHEI